MRMKFEMLPALGETSFGISHVDEEGNGIILLHGKLGGADFLSEKEKASRVKLIEQMVGAWNDRWETA